MELFRIIKKDSRSAMRSFGGRAIAAVMIVLLAYLAINLAETVLLLVFCGTESLYSDFYGLAENSAEALAVTAGSAVVYLLVMPALYLGYTKLYLAFAEGKDESISVLFDMFSSVKRFFASAAFSVSCVIRYLFTFIIAMAPGASFLYVAENFINPAGRTVEILKIAACCIAIAIMILCAGLWLIFIQRWSLAPFYFAEGNGFNKSFVLSAKATKGMNTRIISFRLSFLGWIIPSILILPMLWSVPYYFLSNAIFSRYLMERYERFLAQAPEISIPEESFEPETEPEATPDP